MNLLSYQSKFCRALFFAAATISAVIFSSSSSLATGDAPATTAEPDELADWGLPPDVGREEVEIYCNACHSLRLVAQQGMSKADWDELFNWMVEEQEMEVIPPEDRMLVLNYLAKYRNVDRKLKIN